MLWLAVAPFKGRSGGGLAAIGLTTGKDSIHPRVRRNLLNPTRYADTDLDPYNAERGFWWVSGGLFFRIRRDCPFTIQTQSHVVWMLVKPRIKPGPADISDLRKNAVVQWQYRNYFAIAFIWGIVIPTVIPGHFWGDWRGGCFYAGFFRILAVHHVRKAATSSFIELADKFRIVYLCSQLFGSLAGRKHVR